MWCATLSCMPGHKPRRVLSKQPEVQQQDFPGPQWDSPLVAVFGFDFGWVVPVCTIDYYQQYLPRNIYAIYVCRVCM